MAHLPFSIKIFKVLQEKNALLKKSINPVDGDNPSRISQLETKCLELKQQIYEMEVILIIIYFLKVKFDDRIQ